MERVRESVSLVRGIISCDSNDCFETLRVTASKVFDIKVCFYSDLMQKGCGKLIENISEEKSLSAMYKGKRFILINDITCEPSTFILAKDIGHHLLGHIGSDGSEDYKATIFAEEVLKK